jgi:ATP-dependent DNA helicase RecG
MKDFYQSITKKTRDLINRPEGFDVEFKSKVEGVKPEDFVAFANSDNGGVMLLGIDEEETSEGQKGVVVGCNISDKSKLSIINKAESCFPPVEIFVVVENADSDKPIFRVEIPSGTNKPYCTHKGIYNIRGNGRNIPLLPTRLLSMFLENEGNQFINRFENATDDLSNTLDVLQNKFFGLEEALEGIWGSAEEAGSTSEMILSALTEFLTNNKPK